MQKILNQISRVRLTLIGISVLILNSCSSTASPFPPYSGFLGDYHDMYRSNVIQGLVLVNNPEKNITDYSKFLVEPVSLYLTPETKAHSLDPETLKKYANAFQQDLRIALGRKYSVVDEPGEGVLRIRAAITEIEVDSVGNLKKGAVEIDFIDAGTNQRVLAIVDSRKVSSFSWWANTLANRMKDLSKKTIVITTDTK